jgi:hypothetical protein
MAASSCRKRATTPSLPPSGREVFTGALVPYLGSRPGGVWQSLQVAKRPWLDLVHPSSCGRITWQFAQAAAS